MTRRLPSRRIVDHGHHHGECAACLATVDARSACLAPARVTARVAACVAACVVACHVLISSRAVTFTCSQRAWDEWDPNEQSPDESSDEGPDESPDEESADEGSSDGHVRRQRAKRQRAQRLWKRNAAQHCRMVGMHLIGLQLGVTPHLYPARLPLLVIMLIARMSIATPCPPL